ncbi:MAG: hypothetical protein Q8P10_02980 [bacterium]|nr:hypothetical protein [bacterium]
MQEINQIQENWSKKRILIGLVILTMLVAAGYFVKINFLDNGAKGILDKVKGASTFNQPAASNNQNQENPFSAESPKLNNDIQQKLDSVKKRINDLNVSDMATSSPYVQKIISDLQSLEQLPKNQAREACFNICKGI